MQKTNFENLRIYQLAETLADKVWNIAVKWDFFAKDTVGKQLVRAADSVGANIAEGSGRGSNQDYKRFLKIARGSLNETRHFLRCAYRRKLVTPEEANEISPIIEELTPKLNAYIGSIGTFKPDNADEEE